MPRAALSKSQDLACASAQTTGVETSSKTSLASQGNKPSVSGGGGTICIPQKLSFAQPTSGASTFDSTQSRAITAAFVGTPRVLQGKLPTLRRFRLLRH